MSSTANPINYVDPSGHKFTQYSASHTFKYPYFPGGLIFILVVKWDVKDKKIVWLSSYVGDNTHVYGVFWHLRKHKKVTEKITKKKDRGDVKYYVEIGVPRLVEDLTVPIREGWCPGVKVYNNGRKTWYKNGW